MKKLTIIIPAPIDKKIPIEVLSTIDKRKVNVIIERGTNPSKNRNRGIRRARTEFVAFTNIHSRLADDWYERVIEFFQKNKKISAVGGPQHTPRDGSPFQRASGYALESTFGSAIVKNRYNSNKEDLDADETKITSANLICRKEVFKKVMFNESLYPGEDPRFIEDLKREGFGVAYSPRIIGFNQRRGRLGELAKQIYNYGIVRPKKESITQTINRPYFLIPTIFLVYLIILPSLLALFKLDQLFLAPLYAYIVLHAIFTLSIGIKKRDIQTIKYMPMIFLVIHLSYGWGFFCGIINKLLD